MITVVLVEDHVSFAQALTAVIGLTGDLQVAASAVSADGIRALLTDRPPDVMIVDLDLPGGSGVDVLNEARDVAPGTRCIVLTALTDTAELGRAVEAGAAAVLHKSVDIAELIEVIRRVAAGDTVLPAEPTSSWLRSLAAERERGWRARTIDGLLTPRERQILELLARGTSGRAIAGDLKISDETVQTHVRNLLGKLGVGSRLEAVTLALQLGIVAPPQDEPT